MAKKFFAVLGDPIAHSLSPLIHTAAYKVLDLDWHYEAIRVPEGELEKFLSGADKFDGFSVTMPLKLEAAKLAESLDDVAAATGVVNTLLHTNTGFMGLNTDCFGITQSTSNITINSAAVLGSGATARSAIYALNLIPGVTSITCYGRNPSTLKQIEHVLGAEVVTKSFDAYQGFEDLTINTVPDFTPSTYRQLLNTSYSASEQLAPNQISGIEMLLWQALAQLRIFTSGRANQELPNESDIISAMRDSLIAK